jgi:hypothetical protein
MLASVGFVAVTVMEFIEDTGFTAVRLAPSSNSFHPVCELSAKRVSDILRHGQPDLACAGAPLFGSRG